ncbi:MAG: hypothetical protein ACK56E_12215 [Planctomyces sp.]|jgi:hypothetical protein
MKILLWVYSSLPGGPTWLPRMYAISLGQLEHGVCYEHSWLQATGQWKRESERLGEWPYAAGSKVRLFLLAGHRIMKV